MQYSTAQLEAGESTNIYVLRAALQPCRHNTRWARNKFTVAITISLLPTHFNTFWHIYTVANWQLQDIYCSHGSPPNTVCVTTPGMCSRTTWSRPRPGVFEAKAKATKFCPRAVLEVEASPRGPHP